MTEIPTIINDGTITNEFDITRFVNGFTFPDMKRFYFNKHPAITVVPAWQGHQFKTKYLYQIKGSFVVA